MDYTELPYYYSEPNYADEVIVEESFSYVETFDEEYQELAQKIFDSYMLTHNVEDLTEVDIINMDTQVFVEIGIPTDVEML